MKQISPLELSQKDEGSFYLLDVRNPNEQEICTIPKTDVLIPVAELPERFSEILAWKEKEVIVYCRSGVRSLRACEILAEKGFTDVANLQGGILAYIDDVDSSLAPY
ncbi:MAG: rhodanese-like domain-containing protein [Spirochaetota bacterium]